MSRTLPFAPYDVTKLNNKKDSYRSALNPMKAMCTALTLTRTRLGAMLVHGVFTCFRHFSWDMKLHTAGKRAVSVSLVYTQGGEKS